MKVWEGNWKGWINRQSKKISGHQLEFWVSTKPRLIIAVCCLGSDFKSHPEKKRCDWSMCNALVTIRNGCGGDAGDNKMMWNCRCLLLPPPWKQPWQLQIKLYKKKKINAYFQCLIGNKLHNWICTWNGLRLSNCYWVVKVTKIFLKSLSIEFQEWGFLLAIWIIPLRYNNRLFKTEDGLGFIYYNRKMAVKTFSATLFLLKQTRISNTLSKISRIAKFHRVCMVFVFVFFFTHDLDIINCSRKH